MFAWMIGYYVYGHIKQAPQGRTGSIVGETCLWNGVIGEKASEHQSIPANNWSLSRTNDIGRDAKYLIELVSGHRWVQRLLLMIVMMMMR